MKRLGMMLIGVSLLLAACGGKGASSLGPAPSGSPSSSESPTGTPGSPTPSTSPSETPTTSPSPTSAGKPFTYQVWFARDDNLFVTRRTEPFTQAVARMAVTAMLAGPNSAETAAGVTSAVPDGTQLLGIVLASDGVITVDMNSTFASGGGTLSVTARLAQLVYTVTQFSTVKSMNLKLDGQPVTSFSSEGIVLDHPQTRSDYEDLLPAITVESPSIGPRVSNPVTISGTANVFEATVSIRILAQDGTELARTFTSASCGTGCRGDYSVAVNYSIVAEAPGTIEVFESSAQDGSAINVVDIPVILTP
jgi:germination protein M